ncbi:MAG: hypothetical protein RR569_09865 [Acinetobacter sp.]
MQLSKLCLCLLGLSLSACSTHVVKNNTNQDVTQRAVQGFNALYEYPSFDYRGQVRIQLNKTNQDQNNSKDGAEPQLDPTVEKKLEQYLKQQKIQLTTVQKKELYQTLAQQNSRDFNGFVSKGADVVQSILNDLQINYDGIVNYRQKVASFNIETKYKKPNLSVEMRIPTVIDFNDYKFYTQIFSFIPYLASPEDQNKYAYYDFSKFKNEISRVDTKAFVEFLKQSGAISYVLSPADQIETLKLTSAEQQAGIVEKIRLNTSLEELILQASLYSSVNREYFVNSVLGLNPSTLEKISEEYETNTKKRLDGSAAEETTANSSQEASDAMYKLYDAVNKTVYGSHKDDDAQLEESEKDVTDYANIATDTAQANQYEDEEESTATDDEYDDSDVDDESEDAEKILTEQQCQDLAKTKLNTRFGDVEYCDYHYEIDLLNAQQEKSSPFDEKYAKKSAELNTKFVALSKKDHLVDANEFKQLWIQHQADVDASLPPQNQRNPMVVDLALDEKGRAVKVDYDVGMDFGKLNRKLNVKFDMQFLNYGNATKIDRQVLNEAKSFKDIFNGSLIGSAVGGFTKSLPNVSGQSYLSLDERLDTLAEQVFVQTGSYEKTYKTVFIAKLTAKKPDLVKQYSAQDLQEIATVYAYSYSDEGVYNPKGNAFKHIEALQKKHHLEDDHQYDDTLGNSVNNIVTDAMKAKQNVLDIQKLQKQYKTTEAVFAQYYTQQFEAENKVEKEQRAEFLKTVSVLAKSYTALKKNSFNDQLVASLNEDSVEFIDYDLFKKTYQALTDAQLK